MHIQFAKFWALCGWDIRSWSFNFLKWGVAMRREMVRIHKFKFQARWVVSSRAWQVSAICLSLCIWNKYDSTWTFPHMCSHICSTKCDTHWRWHPQCYSHVPWNASPWQGQQPTECFGRSSSGLTGEGWGGKWLDGWRMDRTYACKVKKTSEDGAWGNLLFFNAVFSWKYGITTSQHWLLHAGRGWTATPLRVSVDGWLRDMHFSCHAHPAQRTYMHGLHWPGFFLP